MPCNARVVAIAPVYNGRRQFHEIHLMSTSSATHHLVCILVRSAGNSTSARYGGRDVKMGRGIRLERFQAQFCSNQMGNPGWAYDYPKPVDWDNGALTYLETFLTSHTPYTAPLPDAEGDSQRWIPTKLVAYNRQLRKALTRRGKPSWN